MRQRLEKQIEVLRRRNGELYVALTEAWEALKSGPESLSGHAEKAARALQVPTNTPLRLHLLERVLSEAFELARSGSHPDLTEAVNDYLDHGKKPWGAAA